MLIPGDLDATLSFVEGNGGIVSNLLIDATRYAIPLLLSYREMECSFETLNSLPPLEGIPPDTLYLTVTGAIRVAMTRSYWRDSLMYRLGKER